MNKREERPTELLIPRRNAAELFEFIEEPFNLLSQRVLPGIVMNRLGAIRP